MPALKTSVLLPVVSSLWVNNLAGSSKHREGQSSGSTLLNNASPPYLPNDLARSMTSAAACRVGQAVGPLASAAARALVEGRSASAPADALSVPLSTASCSSVDTMAGRSVNPMAFRELRSSKLLRRECHVVSVKRHWIADILAIFREF